MPAGSEQPGAAGLPALPVTWRPLGPRIAGIAGGSALFAITALMWFVGFDQETRDSVTWLQRGTVIAMYLLGFSCLYALARCRAEAREEGLVVVNGYRRRVYDWAEIVAVRLNPGAPWVVLDLADGTTASVMGIQGSDGARAKQAVRQLRLLVDRADPPRH
ncbi:PH domain-containing protein [Nocardioides sp. 1609]|uniref:PH domain-containing protein n=1 Tax=Nocardioides sp. 1609 TaxID=2508327 RepID=UPI00106FF5CA|nr:PH domain-containing protein [Nocardioides sp. 1609]